MTNEYKTLIDDTRSIYNNGQSLYQQNVGRKSVLYLFEMFRWYLSFQKYSSVDIAENLGFKNYSIQNKYGYILYCDKSCRWKIPILSSKTFKNWNLLGMKDDKAWMFHHHKN